MSSRYNTTMKSANKTHKTAPLYRQFFAMFYDSLLIISMLFITTAILLGFNDGEAITAKSSPLYPVFLLVLVFTFYAWFWVKTGQTLGMRVWKIKIIHDDGYLPNWQHSYVRLFFALLSIAPAGLGYLWQLAFGYTWHDKLSHTRIIDIREAKTTEEQES